MNREGSANAGLAESMLSCSSLDEFMQLLEKRGIWLNNDAAQAAFGEVERLRSGELSDRELAAVGGGTRFCEPFDMVSFLENAVSRYLT